MIRSLSASVSRSLSRHAVECFILRVSDHLRFRSGALLIGAQDTPVEVVDAHVDDPFGEGGHVGDAGVGEPASEEVQLAMRSDMLVCLACTGSSPFVASSGAVVVSGSSSAESHRQGTFLSDKSQTACISLKSMLVVAGTVRECP